MAYWPILANISENPIFKVNDDDTVLMGNYLSPSLNSSISKSVGSGLTNIYSISSTFYTAAFFDYSVSDGTNLRSGTVKSIWDGVNISWDDETNNGIGSSGPLLTFNMILSAGTAILQSSGATSGWTIKTIVRAI